VGLLLRPVRPVLEPHPPRPLQKLPLTSIGPTLHLPDLVARLHHILDDVEFVVHHLSVPQVAGHPLGVGRAHVDGHTPYRLGMPVVPQQFRSKCLPNRGILAGRRKQHPLGEQVGKHRQVVVPFAPVHLVGSHPHHIVEAQPIVRRLDVGEEHPPHPGVALAEDLPGALHGHLAHQGQGKGLKLLGEVLAASLPGRSDTIHLAVVATAASRQRTNDHALLVEDVEVPPLHRLDMVVTGHLGASPSAFFRPQLGGLLDAQDERRGTGLEARFHHSPGFAKPQQLSKRLLGCHRPRSSCGRQAPPIPLEVTKNL